MTLRTALLLLGCIDCLMATAGELRVSTGFEGGSAVVESIVSAASRIRFMPAGDPQRGWPCWWYLRVDGVAKGARLTLDLAGSSLPYRNDGKDTGKPLAASWAMPDRATFSTDGRNWQHTLPGRRDGNRIAYEVVGTGGSLWIAWGPPFTPKDTEALIKASKKSGVKSEAFELARTREGRAVRGMRVGENRGGRTPAVWVHARQHAWESGASWVARGFVEWLVSKDADARWLRENAEVFIVPIMDVDNVATGNGGKEANPRDHNRDWDDKPVYPEVAAAQKRLLGLAKENRLELFLDLHNPAPGDRRPFFFCGPPELLPAAASRNQTNFLTAAGMRIDGPLSLEEKTRITGPSYHPLWKQISGQWVTFNGNPHTVAACLETSWNTMYSTPEGYRRVGSQLGQAVADHLRWRSANDH
ncbi:MAG TPA: M14 family zinc carboxypeptidase [Roseimicrobium sp.]|nr:M14 family zinc carboxypeptidase [Roseimicrobium sp.]